MAEKTKILIVDDDSGIGEMLKTLLEVYGHHVTHTELPDETEAIIHKEKIDLVLLDMLISGVHGTDVCRRLRGQEQTKDIPILMMSALHEAGKKCKDAGADDFIAKPFEVEEILGKIDRLIQERQ